MSERANQAKSAAAPALTHQNPDALIIGGGVIGLSCAFRLARNGLRVAVLERGDAGRESSWAGAGILLAGSAARNDPLVQLRRRSIARYDAFIAELRERSGIDPEYRLCGCLDLITDDNQLAAAQHQLSAAANWNRVDQDDAPPPRLELLSAEQAHECEPALSREIRGALHILDAAQVRNPRLIQALRRAAESVGIEIHEQSPLTGLVLNGARAAGAKTPDRAFSAAHVVLCGGAWTAQFAPPGVALPAIYPVRGQIVLLERHPSPIRRILEHGKSYLVARGDGKILVGSTEEHDSGFDKRNTAGGVAHLLQQAQRLVPELRSATLLRAWAGLRPGTPDGRPVIGPVPGIEGLWVASGHFRSGLTLAPITADVIAQSITTGRPELDLGPFSAEPKRPSSPSENE